MWARAARVLRRVAVVMPLLLMAVALLLLPRPPPFTATRIPSPPPPLQPLPILKEEPHVQVIIKILNIPYLNRLLQSLPFPGMCLKLERLAKKIRQETYKIKITRKGPHQSILSYTYEENV